MLELFGFATRVSVCKCERMRNRRYKVVNPVCSAVLGRRHTVFLSVTWFQWRAVQAAKDFAASL